MKKFRNVMLIIISISVITFITSFALGFKAKNIEEFFTESYRYEKADTYLLEDEIKTLNINTYTRIIKIRSHELNNIQVDYFNKVDKESVKFIKEGNVLSINEVKDNKIFNFQVSKNEVRTIEIVVPKDIYIDLNIKVNTGTTTIESLKLNHLIISNDTGNINIKNSEVLEDISIKVDTGNIKIEEVTSRSLNVKTDTGKIIVNNSKILKNKLETETGTVTINQLDSKSINLKTETGSINITGNYINHDKELRVDTGRITENGIRIKGKTLIENREPNYGKLIAVTNTGSINLITRDY